MKRPALTVTFVAVALLFSADHLVAQDLTRYLIEGRFGSIHIPAGGFLNSVTEGNHFSLGFLFSYRPVVSEESLWNRLTFRGSLDGAGLGGQDVTTGLKDIERLYLLNFAVGLDAIQTPRFDVTFHGGGALSRDHFVVQAFSPFGGAFGTGGFVGACNLGPNLCQSIWNLIGNYGVEGRFVPNKSWSLFFVGVDYTRFAGSKNQTMFITGIAF